MYQYYFADLNGVLQNIETDLTELIDAVNNLADVIGEK